MGLKDKMRLLERELRGNLDSFVLEDGSRFYYDPAGAELFLHMFDCLHAQADGEPFPPPPEVLKAVARAKHREAAFQQVVGASGMDLFPYETEALISRGEIVPRSLVHGHELGEGPIADLSEEQRGPGRYE
jgi:hypothetical protein